MQTMILAHGGMMTADEIAMYSIGAGFFFGLPIIALLYVLVKRRRDAADPDKPERDADDVPMPPDYTKKVTDEAKAEALAGHHDIDRGWR